MSEICDVGTVTAVPLTPCHWVANADVSKQCISFILTSQVDGVEFFTSSFRISFKTGMDLEGSRRGPVGVQYRNLAEESEEEHERLQPGSHLSLHKFESATAQIQVQGVTAKLCCSV
jgi:hypothetical protein